MSLKGKLTRLKTHMKTETAHAPVSTNQSCANLEIPFASEWEKLQAKPYFHEDGYSIIREVTYPINHRHGNYCFSDLIKIQEQWKESGMHHPLSCADNDITDMVFFDTETTGLSGGSGTYIFLLGYAKIVGDTVVVKQYFLPNPGAETALYYHFITDMGKSLDLLTSFNGKAFDWPQVKTRHTFVRNEVPKLPQFAHFDLLHASRRLWKDTLPSCKLSVIENKVLGFTRENDTPGYMAPMLYFDFLSEQDPGFVEGVLKHNEWDVLSLIGLYIHLSECLLQKDRNKLSAKECYHIGRWYAQLGHDTPAIEFLNGALHEEGEIQSAAYYALGMLLKRQKRVEVTLSCFEKVNETSEYYWQASVELAKMHEHVSKDLEKALFYTKKAYASFNERYPKTKLEAKLALEQRLRRLTEKLEKC